MKNLKEKLRKNGGFTLVEMLIVVAIIAILIAVSIPMVGTALERSRHGVDQANIRDAVSLANIELLTNDDLNKGGKVTEFVYCVDPDSHQGSLKPAGTTANALTASCTCDTKPGDPLKVKIDPSDGKVVTNWKFDTANNKTASNAATYDALKVEP